MPTSQPLGQLLRLHTRHKFIAPFQRTTDQDSKFLLLRNWFELNAEPVLKLELVLEHSPCLRIAYGMKEEVWRIYETSQTVKHGHGHVQFEN
jgi:hypothetical protein